ncbi:MAG TPA: hypothetical protein DCL44_10295 [Elusimicrobia bacterium]|nr:hypothetical protein [Elusimicrobiota bacterium]
MKKLVIAMFMTAGFALGSAAMEDDDLSEQLLSTDTARPSDEEDFQAVIQEADSDMVSFVRDYITRDSQLKGAFFIENPVKKQILSLKLISLSSKTKDAPDSAKTLSALFSEASGKKHEVLFYLQSSSFGGAEIAKIELKLKPSVDAVTKPPAKKKK